MTHYPYRPLPLCVSVAPELSTTCRDTLTAIWHDNLDYEPTLLTTYLDHYFKVLTHYSNSHMTCIAIRSQVDDGPTGCLMNCKLKDRVAALVFNSGLVTKEGNRVFLVARSQPSHWLNGQAMGDICSSSHASYQYSDFIDGSYLRSMWYVTDVITVSPGDDLKWNYCTIISSSLPVRPPGPGIDVPSAPVLLTVAPGVKLKKACLKALEQRVDLCSSTPVFHWQGDVLLNVLLVQVTVKSASYYIMVADTVVVAVVDAATARIISVAAGYY